MRPRTTTPEYDEVLELGQDLVKWATEETEEPRTLWSAWYALKHGLIEQQWKLLKQREEFRPFYEIARASLAQKLHKGTLEKTLAHRYLGLYDRSLNEFENEEKDKDIRRKKEAFDDSMNSLSDYKKWLDQKKI